MKSKAILYFDLENCFEEMQKHIVFAFLHAMGKYIKCSGLDEVLIEAGIYGPATLD